MATQKFKLFLMHFGMPAVPIQSNKIASNEVKDNEVLLEQSSRKN